MASLNKVMIIGNTCKEIDLRYTNAGTAVASFTVATNERFKNKSGEWEDKAEFHSVTLWGKLAEIAGEYLSKGSTCYIEGRLQTRKWQDKDGKDRYTTEIVGEKMQMLGGKGKDGGSGQGGGGGHGNDEPSFDPDADVPF